MSEHSIYDRFIRSGCCVIIPARNAGETIGPVIEDVLKYTDRIIVVDDGSTDNTARVIRRYRSIYCINIPENKGKGHALKTGFEHARNLDLNYAIAMDADGKHLASDLPAFLDIIEKEHGMLVIGSDRPEPVQGKIQRRRYDFFFWLKTGIKLRDTRSRYRLYPLDQMKRIKTWTNRFEFDNEVLLRCAWNEVPFRIVQVSRIGERITRGIPLTRMAADFLLIRTYNFIFFWMAMVYYWPRLLFRSFSRENLRLFVVNHLLKPDESNFRKAAAVSLGFFLGVSPFWGWHTLLAMGLSTVLKLNKAITVISTNFSIPPLIPLVIWASYELGGKIVASPTSISFDSGISLQMIRENLVQYLLGSFLLGILLAAVSGLMVFILLRLVRKRQDVPN